MDDIGPISDPAGALFTLAALVALAAAFFWFRVGKGNSDAAPNWRDLRSAAMLTAFALVLASIGQLI